MLYGEMMVVYSEIHTGHVITLCGHRLIFLEVKPGGVCSTLNFRRLIIPSLDTVYTSTQNSVINPLNAELNPIRHLPALVGARHIVHVSRIRVK